MEKQATMEKQTTKLRMILKKIFVTLATFFTCFMYNGCYVHASTNFGENIGNWFLDQLLWIAIIIIIIALVGCLSKKAWIGAIGVIIGGAIVLAIIAAPDTLKTIGQNLWNIVTSGTGG